MPVKAVIDLRKIRNNAKKVKDLLPAKTKLCAVVKADAYGHGAAETAAALYKIADCFAVATVEEGIALRLSGIDKEILVLTKAFKSDAEIAVIYRLTLTAESLQDLKLYSSFAKKSKTEVSVHLKYDTGMHRQGFSGIKELNEAFKFCGRRKYISADGLYTHYAAPENEKSLKTATDKFLIAINLAKGYNKNIVCHASASGGFLCGKFFDMVRIGILLYGYTPFKTDKIKVSPAMKVIAPVVRRREIKKGESALYGVKQAKEDFSLTLVRYGYADGLFRKEIKGQFNSRCMDVTAMTDIKGENFVTVMDDAEKLARDYGTISYEILVKCALRAEKIYLR